MKRKKKLSLRNPKTLKKLLARTVNQLLQRKVKNLRKVKRAKKPLRMISTERKIKKRNEKKLILKTLCLQIVYIYFTSI